MLAFFSGNLIEEKPVDKKEIEKKVIGVLADKASMDPKQVELESFLMDDLGLDSLDAVEMVFELEENYGIDIPDEQIPKFRKAGDIVNYLSLRLASA